MLLTDEKTIIKPMKRVNLTSLSKVNNKGELIISIRYWFQDKHQIEKISTCKQVLIESFFALSSPRNTYSFVVQMKKDEQEGWKCERANTYRRKKHENIKYLKD